MTYTATFAIDLGPAYTGLTLQAQLVTVGGIDSGVPIAAGFVERPAASGIYLFSTSLADDFRGYVEFQDAADDSHLATAAIAPEELNPLAAQVPGAYASGSAGAALGRITAATLTVVSPVAESGDVSIIRGDDYLATNGRALEWSSDDWPTLTGGTILFSVQKDAGTLWSKAGSVTGPTAVRVELTAAETEAIGAGVFGFDIQATIGGAVTTLVRGVLAVSGDVR